MAITLTKFVDSLPIPQVVKPKRQTKSGPFYEIDMREVKVKLHCDLPETTVWGYNGQYPGPTIKVYQGEAIHVKWTNHLPNKHLFPVDSHHGGGHDEPEVRTVVHLHGGKTPPTSDGYPESWFTSNFKEVGPTFTQEVYTYPNEQRATTLWYHDHAMGITAINVYAGLAGFYLIHDEYEQSLNLPKDPYDIPLLIQDRSFNEDGSLLYQQFGDFILVNGKVWPNFEVEPRKYRFRILNGSNSRTYRIALSNGQSMVQIGSDGGFLEKPVELKELTIAPAERMDLIIDFRNHFGEAIILTNSAPFPPVDPETTGIIMRFHVNKPLSCPDDTVIPSAFQPIIQYRDDEITKVRQMTLDEGEDRDGNPIMLLNNQRWHDPITIKPLQGSIEEWQIINTTQIPHPIHVHLVMFQVVGRRAYDVAHYQLTKELIFIDEMLPPLENERGWKDTVVAPPGFVTFIRAKFAPYKGLYVWHCHILEHEDYEMMLPFMIC